MYRTLYLTRNSLLEPLGQSQAGYLNFLSKHYEITLITYEKKENIADKKAFLKAQEKCNENGIIWLPQYYYSKPRTLASLFNIIHMVFLLKREVAKKKIDLIHARSYIPAAAALIINSFTKIPFVFDMRALWPEELIIAKRINRGSLIHKAIVFVERKCLAKSAAVVSLTKVAIDYLKKVYPTELLNQKMIVIPTCANLKRFSPCLNTDHGKTLYGSVGTLLSGWFRIDYLNKWMNTVFLMIQRHFLKSLLKMT